MSPTRLDRLECARCGATHDPSRLHNRCSCGGTLLPRYELGSLDLAEIRARPGGPARYTELLPLAGNPVSLGEAETPLLSCRRLSERCGAEVWVKDDSFLPGGTFKARGAYVGLNRALELGATSIVMPSAGNAGGAWALYAARAGVPITVTMARTAPAMNKAEVSHAGATLELVEGSIADAGRRAAEIAAETGAFLAATFNEPYRIEGKKSAWLELFDRLGGRDGFSFPGTVVLPVGGGVAAIALAKAVAEVRDAKWAGGPGPTIVGVQAADCAPIVAAFDAGLDEVAPWESPSSTMAAGLRVPAPSEGWLVLKAVRASGGTMIAVTEAEIAGAVRDLASTEGIYACPEGAATLAALKRLADRSALREPVVLYNTGAGAKYTGMVAGDEA